MFTPPQPHDCASVSALLIDEMGMSNAEAGSVERVHRKAPDQEASAIYFLRAAINYHIDVYQLQSMDAFSMRVVVSPALRASPVKWWLGGPRETAIGYDAYDFEPLHNNERPTRLRVCFGGGSVRVWLGKKWQPIDAYLDSVGRKTMTGPEGTLTQQSWWNSNGKSFPFMDLPGELRNRIYEHLLPPMVVPFPRARCRKGTGTPAPWLAITKVSKAVNKEANYILYTQTLFLLDDKALTDKFLRDNFLLKNVRQLTISTSLSDLFDMFGAEAGRRKLPFFNLRGARASEYAQRIEELTSNDLPFEHARVVKGFRAMSLLSLRINIERPSEQPDKKWLKDVCVKRAVGLLVDLAWPSLRGLPLELIGCVEQPQKGELEARVSTGTGSRSGAGVKRLTWDQLKEKLKCDCRTNCMKKWAGRD